MDKIYFLEDNKLVFDPRYGIIMPIEKWTDSEWELDQIKKLPIINDNQAADTFPEAETITKSLIREYRRALGEIRKLQTTIKELCFEKVRSPKNLELLTDMAIAAYGKVKEQQWYEKQIKRLEKISTTQNYKNVKDIPISNFIELNRANKCRCPFGTHEDKDGSFTYYPQSNSFYCFGCNVGGDIITFIQQLHKCSFREALNILKK
jgi:hypothetical protein